MRCVIGSDRWNDVLPAPQTPAWFTSDMITSGLFTVAVAISHRCHGAGTRVMKAASVLCKSPSGRWRADPCEGRC